MYGVPADLDLRQFEGATLVQVAVGEYQVQLRFDKEAEISIEGQWELRLPGGQVQSGFDGLCRLAGQAVTATYVNAPRSIVLEFERGSRLEIYDSSKEYESFAIQPGNIIV